MQSTLHYYEKRRHYSGGFLPDTVRRNAGYIFVRSAAADIAAVHRITGCGEGDGEKNGRPADDLGASRDQLENFCYEKGGYSFWRLASVVIAIVVVAIQQLAAWLASRNQKVESVTQGDIN